jgi:hypothetical protein
MDNIRTDLLLSDEAIWKRTLSKSTNWTSRDEGLNAEELIIEIKMSRRDELFDFIS